MSLETGNLHAPRRAHPSQTSTGPITALQLVRKLGVTVRSPESAADEDTSSPDSDSDSDVDIVPTTHSPVRIVLPESVARGRPPLRVTFAAPTGTNTHPEGKGARPLSAPPYPRDAKVSDNEVDFSGYDTESDRQPSTSDASRNVTDTPTDDEIRKTFDWDFITLKGTRPELAAEVWDIVKDSLRLAFGPIPPTDELPVVISLRLRDGATLPHRRQPTFRAPLQAQINAQLDRLVAAGIHEIVPPGTPKGANSMVFGVPKPNCPTEIRVVTDFSEINKVTINESFCSLPKDILAMMQPFQKARCFSSLDCKDSFYGMALHTDSRDLTMYTRPGTNQRYRSTRAVQGGRDMANYNHNVINTAVTSPITPQSHKDSYMDDIMIGTKSDATASDSHRSLIINAANDLVSVVDKLCTTGQRLKLSKCIFLSPVGNLVGFQTDGETVWRDPARIAPIRNLSAPTDMKSARRMYGLILSRSQSLARASDQLQVVNDFIRADKWPSTGLPIKVRDAFLALRDAIVNNTPLYLVDPSIPIHVRNDASAKATGGVIAQYDQHTGQLRDIAFFYHLFNATQQKYSTNLREFLGLTLNMLRYRHILRNCRVIGWVDHQNLLYLSRSDNQRLLRMSLTALGAGIHFSLMYEPGVRMYLEDALSRATLYSAISASPDIPQSPPVMSQSSSIPAAFVTLAHKSAPLDTAAVPSSNSTSVIDPAAAPSSSNFDSMPALASIGTPPVESWTNPSPIVLGLPQNLHPLLHSVVAAQQSMTSVERATFLKREHAAELRLGTVPVLYISRRIYVPSSAKAIHQAYVAAVHDIVCASATDMVERLRNNVKVTWDTMAADAQAYRKSCGRCQHAAAGSQPNAVGSMQSFLYSAPNDTVFMDIYGPLPECERASPLDPTGTVLVYRYIFTLTDAYSRFTIFLPSTHKNAKAAIAAYLHWRTFFGLPRLIRTDGDKVFESAEFLAALASNGSTHDPVSAYTHHQMGLLERTHAMLGNLLRVLGGHAVSEWVDFIPIITAWRNSCLNRSIGVSSHEGFFCRPSTFAYERLGLNEVISVSPNELSNLVAAQDLCIRTSAAVATTFSAAHFDSSRSAPPVFKSGDTVLVYFEDRPGKTHTYYRGPFVVLSPADTSGNYYSCRDMIQFIEYDVHVERMKPFDMSRTTIEEQAQRQLPSRDMLIVSGVDGHRMNDCLGLLEFCIRFYSGVRQWKLYPEVRNLDVVKQYVAEHKLNTRQKTPVQQFGSSSSSRKPVAKAPRPLPKRQAPT